MIRKLKYSETLAIILGLISLVIHAIKLSPSVEAATLKQDDQLIGEFGQGQTVANLEAIIAQAFLSIQSDTLQYSFMNFESNSDPQFRLTLDSVVNSLGQLRFDAPDLTAVAEVPVLSKTSVEQIMRGVYDFEITLTEKTASDSFTFEIPQLTASTPNYNFPTPRSLNPLSGGLNFSFYGGMGVLGMNMPAYGGLRLNTGIGVHNRASIASLPVERNSIRAEFIRALQENVDARWDLYPDDIRTEMQTEQQASLSGQMNQIEQILTLNPNVSLKSMPEDIFLTPWDIKDDYVISSPILSQDYAKARLAVTENFRSYLQENAQQRQQELVEYQRGLQKRLYERNQALRQSRSR